MEQEQLLKNAATPLRGIGADKAHVGTRRGQQRWEAAAEVPKSTKQYSPFPRCPVRSAVARRQQGDAPQRSRLASRSAPGGHLTSMVLSRACQREQKPATMGKVGKAVVYCDAGAEAPHRFVAARIAKECLRALLTDTDRGGRNVRQLAVGAVAATQ